MRELCQNLQPDSEISGIGSVQLVETLNLPPFSEQVLMAKVRYVPKGVSCIVEPNTEKRSPCAVARVLVEPKAGLVPITLLNPKPESVSIPASMVIAIIESVEIPTNRVVASIPAKPFDLEPENVEFLWDTVDKCASELTQKEKSCFSHF